MGGLDPFISFAEAALESLRTGVGMDVVLSVVGCVLVWSGLAKLRQPREAAVAMLDFGVVRVPNRRFGLALGTLETLLGLIFLLGFEGLAEPALACAIFLFTVFTILLARALRAEDSFTCACFGGSEGETITGWTVARAISLLVLCSLLVGADTSQIGLLAATQRDFLAFIIAVSVLMTVVLISRFGRLLIWNSEMVAVFEGRATPTS